MFRTFFSPRLHRTRHKIEHKSNLGRKRCVEAYEKGFKVVLSMRKVMWSYRQKYKLVSQKSNYLSVRKNVTTMKTETKLSLRIVRARSEITRIGSIVNSIFKETADIIVYKRNNFMVGFDMLKGVCSLYMTSTSFYDLLQSPGSANFINSWKNSTFSLIRCKYWWIRCL